MRDYLDLGRTGRNDWWRYFISFPSILFFWLLLGSIPVAMLIAYIMTDSDPATNFTGSRFTGVPIVLEFLVTMLSFIPLIVATLLAVRYVHARPVKSLITGAAQIRWGKIVASAVVWMLISALLSLLEALLYPGRYVLTFQPLTLLVFTVFALIFIPIQTSAEELFFRGYLLQWMGLRLRNVWLLSLLNGLLFFLPHTANPEMASGSVLVGLGYFAMGFFLTFITLQDHGIELALGMHAGNNLFAGLLANYSESALPSPALFTIQTLDPLYSILALGAGMIMYYLIFFRLTRSGTATHPG